MGWENRSTLNQFLITASRSTSTSARQPFIGPLIGGLHLSFVPMAAASEDSDSGDDGTGTATITKPKSQTKTPPLYRVILMNDDFTPMDFVIHVIQKFFGKDLEEATQIMLQVHLKGAGICGVFSHEIAETKTHQVNQYSRQNRHPLKCTMEKV